MKEFFDDLIFQPIIPLSKIIPYVLVLLFIIFINRKGIIRRTLIVILVLLITQRPMLRDRNGIAYNRDIDVIFVVDETVSMNAVDGRDGKTRLENVIDDCKHLIENLEGASFALITYDNISLIKYPFTNDVGVMKDVIERMKIMDPNYAIGSTLNLPYDNLKKLLESSRTKEKHKTLVFFMSDGELTEEETSKTKLSTYSNIADLIDSGAVLGYGTKEGAKVKITDSVVLNLIVDKEGFLLDGKTSQVAISKLNEENLKSLAQNMGIDYYYMSDFSIIAEQINNIKKETEENDENEEKMDEDIYYYLSGFVIILLLLELFFCRRNEQ